MTTHDMMHYKYAPKKSTSIQIQCTCTTTHTRATHTLTKNRKCLFAISTNTYGIAIVIPYIIHFRYESKSIARNFFLLLRSQRWYGIPLNMYDGLLLFIIAVKKSFFTNAVLISFNFIFLFANMHLKYLTFHIQYI